MSLLEDLVSDRRCLDNSGEPQFIFDDIARRASWMAFVVQAKEWGLDRVDRVLQGRAQACARFPRLRRQGELRHLPTALNSSTSPPLGARVLPFYTPSEGVAIFCMLHAWNTTSLVHSQPADSLSAHADRLWRRQSASGEFVRPSTEDHAFRRSARKPLLVHKLQTRW